MTARAIYGAAQDSPTAPLVVDSLVTLFMIVASCRLHQCRQIDASLEHVRDRMCSLCQRQWDTVTKYVWLLHSSAGHQKNEPAADGYRGCLSTMPISTFAMTGANVKAVGATQL